jgi:hypothetical protein
MGFDLGGVPLPRPSRAMTDFVLLSFNAPPIEGIVP